MRKLVLCLGLLSLSGCTKTASEYSVPDPISFSGGSVQIQAGSKFMEQIKVVPVGSAPGGERKLSAVGQMIALANPSDDLLKEQVSWVLLDPALPHSLGLPLGEKAPVGLSFGVTTLSSAYRNDIHPGERVEIYRYGLKQGSTAGTIVSVRTNKGDVSEVSVIFSILHGQDWYPGTNCEVEFPLVRREAVAFSPLSMLHEGIREFVLKEVGPGRYAPEEITVVNETRDQVYALGNLSPGDRVVERGAILIKPMVHSILKAKQEADRVQ